MVADAADAADVADVADVAGLVTCGDGCGGGNALPAAAPAVELWRSRATGGAAAVADGEWAPACSSTGAADDAGRTTAADGAAASVDAPAAGAVNGDLDMEAGVAGGVGFAACGDGCGGGNMPLAGAPAVELWRSCATGGAAAVADGEWAPACSSTGAADDAGRAAAGGTAAVAAPECAAAASGFA